MIIQDIFQSVMNAVNAVVGFFTGNSSKNDNTEYDPYEDEFGSYRDVPADDAIGTISETSISYDPDEPVIEGIVTPGGYEVPLDTPLTISQAQELSADAEQLQALEDAFLAEQETSGATMAEPMPQSMPPSMIPDNSVLTQYIEENGLNAADLVAGPEDMVPEMPSSLADPSSLAKIPETAVNDANMEGPLARPSQRSAG